MYLSAARRQSIRWQRFAVSSCGSQATPVVCSKMEDLREAHPSTSFQLVIARWGSRSVDIAEEAVNIAAVATIGDAVGKSCTVSRSLDRGGIVTQAEDDSIVKRSSGEVLASVTISRFEFQKLDRCAVVEDERDPHAWGRRVRRNQDFLAFERGIQIVDGKRQVRDCLHNLRHRTLRVEAHPLDAVRAGLKPADMNAELLQVPLTATGRAVRDAEVVVSPSEPGDGRGIFVPAPYVTHR